MTICRRFLCRSYTQQGLEWNDQNAEKSSGMQGIGNAHQAICKLLLGFGRM